MTICLNMIVKNEKGVILRCLESVWPLIDTYVIVDTGSKDGTQEIIRQFFKEKGLKGELHDQKFIDFETNRNQALELAKGHGDYILFIDADEQLTFEEDFALPPLKEDSYLIECDRHSLIFYRRQLVKAALEWEWVGVLHETIEGKNPFSTAILPGVVNHVSLGGGARLNNPMTLQLDAKILEEAIKKNPFDNRSIYYLAQVYRMLGKKELSLKLFKRRIDHQDGSEEVYHSLLQIAQIKEESGKHLDQVYKAYAKAIDARPTRKEGYFYFARYLRRKNQLKQAYEIAKKGFELPETRDLLGVESKVYSYKMALEYAVIAHGIGKPEEARTVALNLLKQKKLPAEARTLINSIWNPLGITG